MSADRLSLDIALARKTFSLNVRETLVLDGVTAVFGPSGSGKTTLLRAIAGLESGAEGSICFAETVWRDSAEGNFVPAHQRAVAYVFQDARLFSHLDVRGNLDFAAKRARKAGRAPNVDGAVEAFGIQGLQDRRADSLSGGESRRVALARAVLSCPDLMLLDEPLTGLDRAARREILPFLKRLPEQSACPILYVSHDLEEVAALASRIVVMREGQVLANGPIGEVGRSLDLGPLSEGAGPASLIEVQVTRIDTDGGLMALDAGGEVLRLPAAPGTQEGDRLRLFIDARDVAIAVERPGPMSIRNILPAQVGRIVSSDTAADALVDLFFGGEMISAQITRQALSELQLETGQQVFALMKSVRLAGDFR
ncbi:molybdenum ABC transporter ATP-binding protein [Henriciella barbarensis]|uniref:molybdenum ABC transporter ATP-binding protein n=1 Tax=Henriciella barbarensis TaxID=86342 RepID=UPI0015FB2411|nr:molybdenum ABC transporter ATP-binding protein [Henriciella barbarensis]